MFNQVMSELASSSAKRRLQPVIFISRWVSSLPADSQPAFSFLFIWGHTQQCSEVSPGSALKGFLLLVLKGLYGMLGLRARQAPTPLSYGSSSSLGLVFPLRDQLSTSPQLPSP